VTDVVDISREPSTPAPPATRERPPRPGRRRPSGSALAAMAIIALMAFSFVAHVDALKRDLPLQEADEEDFTRPAVHIATTGDLNPHWFGHPGSTVIYPVAALVHTWDAVFHDGPIIGANDDLERRFDENPTPFYEIARLWTITLGVAAIPILYLLGRRAFNRRIALMGTVLWTVLPYPIQADRIVRTESAAIFFGMLALYCCVRVWQEPRRRWWVLAGLAAGVAISSRWFMAAVLPCLLAAVVVPAWPDRRRALRASAYAAGSTLVGFVLTTPFFFLDLSTARHDLNAEANVPHTVAVGLSPPGNARWYLGTAIPASMTWATYVLALIGIVLILRRRVLYQWMLVAFCVIFIVGISVSKLHWQRWSIEVLPLLSLFAAVTIYEVVRWVGARAPASARNRTKTALAVVITGALVVVPLVDLVDVNRRDSEPSSRKLAREWMQEHIPAGSHVLQSQKLFNLHARGTAPIGHGIRVTFGLDPSRPLASYRAQGVDYIATFTGDPFAAMRDRKKNPAAAAFYTDLACRTRLVANIKGHHTVDDFGIYIYRLDQRPVKLIDLVCRQAVPRTTNDNT